jgi:gluconate 5-dehydrogenase
MREASPFDLTGMRGLVTGGNGGIGLGIARELAHAGARLAILGRDTAKNATALAELSPIQPGCRAYAFDLARLDEIPEMYTHISAEMGGIDLLINNAGAQLRGRADQISIPDFERVMRVNLTAPFVLSGCFARERIERGQGGVILLIASLMSEAARPGVAAYTASKGGIRQLVRALAVDWAPFDIRVNGIGPGYIRTEMTHPLQEDVEFNQWVMGRTPLGRWGLPEDCGGAAVFLVSDAARFVTGQILYVDGGWLATY